jgi:hypothetical protein
MSYPACDQNASNPNCTCDAPGVREEIPANTIAPGEPTFWTCCGGNQDLGYCKYTNYTPNTTQQEYINKQNKIHENVSTSQKTVNKAFPQKCYSNYESSTGISEVGCNNNAYPRMFKFEPPNDPLNDCYCVQDKNVWQSTPPEWFTANNVRVSLPINCNDGTQSICNTTATQQNGLIAVQKTPYKRK